MLFKVEEQVAEIEKIRDYDLTEGMKHGNQQANIVKYMEKDGFLQCVGKTDDQMLYVEYGAGKAGLSHFVSSRLSDKYIEEI